MNAPHWSLKTIKGLASQGSIVLTKTKAIAFFASATEAFDTAQEVIAALTSMNFSHSLQQADICDVYGVVIDGAGWYLKVTVQHPTLMVISLHPLAQPLMTNGGEVKP